MANVFVTRGPDGKVSSVYKTSRGGEEEALDKNSSEVRLFYDQFGTEVNPNITDRQFFHALAKVGMISETEALNAVKTGDLPSTFETFIGSLPLEQQFDARILLEGANTFQRDHPLTSAFGQMYGMNEDQIDDLWKLAGSL